MPKRKAEVAAEGLPGSTASKKGRNSDKDTAEASAAKMVSASPAAPIDSAAGAGSRASSRAAALKAKEGIKMMADFEASDSLPASAASSSSAAASLAAGPGKKAAGVPASGSNVVVVTEEYKPHAELFTAAPPKRKPDGTLIFSDAPEFCPNKTPEEILRAGAFGGTYYRDIYSSVTKKHYKDMWKILPKSWISGLNVKKMLSSPVYDEAVNKFGVSCGQSLDAWESSGWISSWDPYGWFHWYCNFYQGRRCDDDERQIGRWKGIAGPTGRWKGNLAAKVIAARSTFDDPNVSPVVRQTLLHWGYELTESDFAAAVKKMKAGGTACYSVPASAYSKANIEKAEREVEGKKKENGKKKEKKTEEKEGEKKGKGKK
jgi:hypothetical protein